MDSIGYSFADAVELCSTGKESKHHRAKLWSFIVLFCAFLAYTIYAVCESTCDDGEGSARSLKHAMQYVHQVVTACRSFNASTRIAIRLGLSVKTLCPPSTTLPFWCAALPQSTSRSPPVLAQPQTCRLSTVAGSRLPLYVLLSAEPLRQLT